MKYYKAVITVEVLTADEPVFWNRLEDVAYAITLGDASGLVELISEDEITEEQLVKECDKHGTDPTFFTMLEDETGMSSEEKGG